MEIVIKVSEEIYKVAKNACRLAGCPKDWEEFFLDVLFAIGGGQTLPEGHGRLIDADKIISEATERMKYPANHKYMECVIAHMKLATTIIEADGGDAE